MDKSLGAKEPFRLKKWKLPFPINGTSTFYTCARPGRSEGRWHAVRDEVVHGWVSSLPRPNTAIVSLLGRKKGPTGLSEFSYYSFCGGHDHETERKGRPSLRDWLDLHHPTLGIIVSEHPTYDTKPVDAETLYRIRDDIFSLFSARRIVVVVDSGGVERTGQVVKYLGAVNIPVEVWGTP